MEIEALLKKSNFSEKEISVYLALLSLGSSGVTEIAKEAGINRSTTYLILDLLTKRGLAINTERRGVKIFSAADSDSLVRHLKNTASQYEELASAARTVRLHTRPKTKNVQPRVQIFEGEQGVKDAYAGLLSSLGTIRARALGKNGITISPISHEAFEKLPQITVRESKIILVSPGENFAAVIESKELAQRLKEILESARKETLQHGGSLEGAL